MTPEEALAAARAAAERRRAAGEDVDLPELTVPPSGGPTLERLVEWAAIEPDPELVYSTRRLGAPITAAKRGLIHTLRQYTGQIVSQQTRFNLQLVVFVSQLAERVARLEEAARARDGEPPGT